MSLTLYDYWRSSAAYRVRIALNCKSLDYMSVPTNLLKGEQKSSGYKARNPMGVVPTLHTPHGDFTQSLAIIEYLNERYPTPPLLPADLEGRAQVRAMAQLIACELHPVNNLRIRDYLKSPLHLSEEKQQQWTQHWLIEGLTALEALVRPWSHGKFCFGNRVTLADLCLVPQLYTARRFLSDLSRFPTLVAVDAHCTSLKPFIDAKPENQPDAVT